MLHLPLSSLDDPRLAPYRNLKDRELAREGDRFIAEGELVVRRLLASDYKIDSVLLAQRRVEEIAPVVADRADIYVVPDDLIHQVIGFRFHSGVIACGRRKPGLTLDAVIPHGNDRLTLVILPETANAENLGSMVRISAAFGADALVLGENCCDPFWRQAVRVSMGTVFHLPLVRSDDLLRDFARLRKEWAVELTATVLDDRAVPLYRFERGPRLGVLFGNEAQGLTAPYVAACDTRITIPMRGGTDSLNVAVAAGIFLYHLTT